MQSARSSWPPWEVTRVCGRSFVSCILKISLSSESCCLKMSTGHELSRRERRPWGSTPAPEKDAVDFLDGRRGRGSELRDTRGETPPFHSRKSPLHKRTTRPLLPERRVGWCLRCSDLASGLHRPRHVLGRLAPHLAGRPDVKEPSVGALGRQVEALGAVTWQEPWWPGDGGGGCRDGL